MADPNLAFPAQTIRQVVVTSGNCFELACLYLEDATQVDRIMAINPQLGGDPWFTGVQTINIPAIAPGAGSGGIFGGSIGS
jgi:hypothetical protein